MLNIMAHFYDSLRGRTMDQYLDLIVDDVGTFAALCEALMHIGIDHVKEASTATCM